MPAEMTAAELVAEARRLDREATPGPWEAIEQVGQKSFGANRDKRWWNVCAAGHKYVARTEESLAAAEVMANNIENNAAFIAFARTALPRLVALVEAAVEMREATIALRRMSLLPFNEGLVAAAVKRLDHAEYAFDLLARGEKAKE